MYEEELVQQFQGARLVVVVEPIEIFPNCPRYVPKLAIESSSPNCPRAGYSPPDAAWKTRDYIKPLLHASHRPGQNHRRGKQGPTSNHGALRQAVPLWAALVLAGCGFAVGVVAAARRT